MPLARHFTASSYRTPVDRDQSPRCRSAMSRKAVTRAVHAPDFCAFPPSTLVKCWSFSRNYCCSHSLLYNSHWFSHFADCLLLATIISCFCLTQLFLFLFFCFFFIFHSKTPLIPPILFQNILIGFFFPFLFFPFFRSFIPRFDVDYSLRFVFLRQAC